MVEHGKIQEHLALSEEYLSAAEALVAGGRLAPAYHNALHALELAVKAALATRLDAVPHTHNVGGLFGREFRGAVGGDLTSRVSTLLHEYDAPRYPEWEVPEDLPGDLAFIARLVRDVIPAIVNEARR